MESVDIIIMNPETKNKWMADVLTQILFALASSKALKGVLVYKGALILNKRLEKDRMSLDIDSNFIQNFVLKIPERSKQEEFLYEAIASAISKYFNRQEPVRFQLSSIKIIRSPRNDHPRGWDAFKIKINVEDFKNTKVRGLPALTIDIAAPEELSENSVSDIDIGGYIVSAYTLERIAGEKLRAFLSTLPAYRQKVKKPGEAVRVKDLYDIARIQRAKPISDELFWEVVGNEFKLACSSRYIDCEGLDTFKEHWGNTQSLYENDLTLPKNIQFDEVDKGIADINEFFLRKKIVPFTFPLGTISK